MGKKGGGGGDFTILINKNVNICRDLIQACGDMKPSKVTIFMWKCMLCLQCSL